MGKKRKRNSTKIPFDSRIDDDVLTHQNLQFDLSVHLKCVTCGCTAPIAALNRERASKEEWKTQQSPQASSTTTTKTNLWSRKTHSSFKDRAPTHQQKKQQHRRVAKRSLRSMLDACVQYPRISWKTAPGALNSEYDGLLGFATFSGRPIAIRTDTDVRCLLFSVCSSDYVFRFTIVRRIFKSRYT